MVRGFLFWRVFFCKILKNKLKSRDIESSFKNAILEGKMKKFLEIFLQRLLMFVAVVVIAAALWGGAILLICLFC